MSTHQLARAVRARATALLDSDYYDDAPSDFRQLARDVAELAHVLGRLLEDKTLARSFGAPGDWGYETPVGAALAAEYPRPDVALRSAPGNTPGAPS